MKSVTLFPAVVFIFLAIILTGCDILFPKGDTEPPTAEITAPLHGTTIYDVAKITADASDNIAVLKVSFYVDGTWVADDESAPYEYDWNCKELVSGEYNLRVTAYDEEGNKGDSEAVTVKVVGKVTGTGSSELTAPSNLTASVNSDGDIELTWTDNSSDEEGFGIFYNTEESYETSEVIGLADADAESYVDSYEFTEGTTYYYFVVAYKDDAEVISDASNWASVVYSETKTVEWESDGTGWSQFFTNDPEYLDWSFWTLPTGGALSTSNDFVGKVKRVSGYTYAGYGVLFYFSDDNNFIRLLITTEGRYSIWQRLSGTWYELQAWTDSSYLNTGYSTENEITVDCVWDNSMENYYYPIYFNDYFIGDVTGLSYTDKNCGYIAVVSEYETFPDSPTDIRVKMTKPVMYPGSKNLSFSEKAIPAETRSDVLSDNIAQFEPAGTAPAPSR